jgi:hypothetical protein
LKIAITDLILRHRRDQGDLEGLQGTVRAPIAIRLTQEDP